MIYPENLGVFTLYFLRVREICNSDSVSSVALYDSLTFSLFEMFLIMTRQPIKIL